MPDRTIPERAAHAEAALDAYLAAAGTTGEPRLSEEVIGDLVTALLHLAAREGHDAFRLLRCAAVDVVEEAREAIEAGIAAYPLVPADATVYEAVRDYADRMLLLDAVTVKAGPTRLADVAAAPIAAIKARRGIGPAKLARVRALMAGLGYTLKES